MFKPLLHYQLTGNTCYVSRIKNHGYEIAWQPFVTLHSLVYKVLCRTTVGLIKVSSITCWLEWCV